MRPQTSNARPAEPARLGRIRSRVVERGPASGGTPSSTGTSAASAKPHDSQKIDHHGHTRSSSPPTSGPMAEPPSAPVNHSPSAKERGRPAGR